MHGFREGRFNRRAIEAFEESRLDDLTSKIYEEWEEVAELISFRVVNDSKSMAHSSR